MTILFGVYSVYQRHASAMLDPTLDDPGIPHVSPDYETQFTFDPNKIGKQMSKRGWTEKLIQDTLDNPRRVVKTRDTRWLPGTDGPLNEPATAYFASDGSYVVRNDLSGEIVQISNKFDPDWVCPWDAQ